MGDPSNKNQAHLIHGRSTSRVLAPPGGHSTFSIGGYGGTPDYSTSDRRNSKSVAPRAEESNQRYSEPPRSYQPRDNLRGSIPGLESHYSGDRGGGGGDIGGGYRNGNGNGGYRRDSNEDASDDNDSGSDSRGQSYDEEDNYHEGRNSALQENSRKKSASQNDCSPQQLMKNMNYAGGDRRQVEGRSDSTGGGGRGSGTSHASRHVRSLADSRHDSAMQAYSSRQESDREKDYRRMQNMEDKNNERNGQRTTGGSNGGSSNYKIISANASGSAPVHTSTRVHAPPGGHSSFQIGWS